MDKLLTRDQSPQGTEDATSSASDDDSNSSFMSPEDDGMEGQDLTSDEEADDINER